MTRREKERAFGAFGFFLLSVYFRPYIPFLLEGYRAAVAERLADFAQGALFLYLGITLKNQMDKDLLNHQKTSTQSEFITLMRKRKSDRMRVRFVEKTKRDRLSK